MVMPAVFEKWTVDLLDALPDSNERFELVHGKLFVTPSPGLPHQRAVLALALALNAYARRIGCELFISPSDVWWEPRDDNRVQPDLYAVRLRDGKAPAYPFHLSDLVLAIEVTSPGRPWYDYEVKRRLYADEGVAEYRIVNLERRDVPRWLGRDERGEVLTDRIEWRAPGASEALALDLESLFDQVNRK